MIDITWKIGGEAGFGIMTTGLVFSKIATRCGYHIYDYVEYPSLVRGGHNAYEVHVSDSETTFLKNDIDVLVCLNKETLNQHIHRLTSQSIVLYDEADFTPENKDFNYLSVPFQKIVTDLKGQIIMKNTVFLGASLAILGGDINQLNIIITEQFAKKGEAVIKFNQQFAKQGYDYILKNYKDKVRKLLAIKSSKSKKLVLTGNDAFSLGSVIADCRFYCAYPMTPSSSVLATLASWGEKTGMIVRHAEDEISVINTALGASHTGVRSSVGTSGGGFALMVETISFLGVSEIPLVIFLSSRPGPATGMPTWTEQGDLFFSIFSGHGEFPKIVLAPGDQSEMIEMTAQAYNLADIYQLPVIVMSDMLLSEGHKSISKDKLDQFISQYKINRGKTISSVNKAKYLRYEETQDGISPRLIPGTPKHYYQTNSYEHLEDSHTTEDSHERIKQVDKRARKWTTYLNNDFQVPTVYGDINKAEIVLVGWGSIKGVVLEAIKKTDKKLAFIHFTYLYPLDIKKVKNIFKPNKKYLLVENNSWGQLGKLLKMEIGIDIEDKLLKYDGRPITTEEIIEKYQILNHK